jgi:hypothetical protein
VRLVRRGLGQDGGGDRVVDRGVVDDLQEAVDVGDAVGQREVDHDGRGHAEVEPDAGTGCLTGLIVVREEQQLLSQRDGGHVSAR